MMDENDLQQFRELLEGVVGVNQNYFRAHRMVCGVALQNYQLPDIPVPEGMRLTLRGDWSNTTPIYVTGRGIGANNRNDSYPLLPNETLMLRVTNAYCIYVAAVTAGEAVCLAVEYATRL